MTGYFLDWCFVIKSRLCCRFVERRAGTKFSAERVFHFPLWVPLSCWGGQLPFALQLSADMLQMAT